MTSSQPDIGPAPKKRKLGPANARVTAQPSFTEVLERLKGETKGSRGVSRATSMSRQTDSRTESEGGADAWARPKLPKLNPKTDKIGASLRVAHDSSLLT